MVRAISVKNPDNSQKMKFSEKDFVLQKKSEWRQHEGSEAQIPLLSPNPIRDSLSRKSQIFY